MTVAIEESSRIKYKFLIRSYNCSFLIYSSPNDSLHLTLICFLHQIVIPLRFPRETQHEGSSAAQNLLPHRHLRPFDFSRVDLCSSWLRHILQRRERIPCFAARFVPQFLHPPLPGPTGHQSQGNIFYFHLPNTFTAFNRIVNRNYLNQLFQTTFYIFSPTNGLFLIFVLFVYFKLNFTCHFIHWVGSNAIFKLNVNCFNLKTGITKIFQFNSTSDRTPMDATKQKLFNFKLTYARTLKNTFGWARMGILGTMINLTFFCALLFSLAVHCIQKMVHADHEELQPANPFLLIIFGSIGIVLYFVLQLAVGGECYSFRPYLPGVRGGPIVLEFTRKDSTECKHCFSSVLSLPNFLPPKTSWPKGPDTSQ